MIERPHAFGEKTYSLLDNVIFSLRKRQVVQRLSIVDSTQTIVDLGSGYDARLLCSLLSQYTQLRAAAVDMAFKSELKQVARLRTVVNDLDMPLILEDSSADMCISLAVLEHLNNPQDFLKEVFRVLKPGGRVVLTTPGPSSKLLLEFLALKLKVIDAAEILDHKNYFSSSDLNLMFTTAGFSSDKIEAKTFIFGMNNVVVAIK